MNVGFVINGSRIESGMTVSMTIFLLLAFMSAEAATNIDYRGHIKYQSLTTNYPGDSLLQNFTDDPARDNNANLRFNFSADKNSWVFNADYQLLVRDGDSVSLQLLNPGILPGSQAFPSDDNRLMDLTHIVSEDGDTITVQRLDRLNFSYTTERTVFRAGRQAVSWGNGLIYNPMDFFNPFDPAAIDKEYKTGDDMLYGQYLFDNGSDLQAVWVGRRDNNGDVDRKVASSAVKYHLFREDYEVDFLLAEHFDHRTLGLGAAANVGGSIWRSDIVASEVDNDNIISAVVNVSYSWIAWNKNVSGLLEFYRNGFGIADGDYSPAKLAGQPELVARLQRGELFTLGRHYLAASATIELTPLWRLTSSLFVNLDDDSSLLQLFSLYDLQQNLQLFAAVNFPAGDEGSEFGGIDSGVPG
ncbi:MAG: hypothetical protein ACC663_09175, partial [Gammaproteobacteria bacterium]